MSCCCINQAGKVNLGSSAKRQQAFYVSILNSEGSIILSFVSVKVTINSHYISLEAADKLRQTLGNELLKRKVKEHERKI